MNSTYIETAFGIYVDLRIVLCCVILGIIFGAIIGAMNSDDSHGS